jgi:hypothetical protein
MRSDWELEPLRSKYLYSFADTVYVNVLGEGDFLEDSFPDLFEGPAKAAKPQRDTLLHGIIRNLLYFYMGYSTRKVVDLETDFYRGLLIEAGMKIPRWVSPEHVSKHIRQLDELLYKAVDVITPSIFYILFSDRQFLMAFQKRVSEYVSELKLKDHPQILSRDGVLKRAKNIPTWLKAGVFYRDHGRCQACLKDLSGLGRPVRDLHIDHIIPLAASGSNDPTNFQLLCSACNLSKGPKKINSPPKFNPYW